MRLINEPEYPTSETGLNVYCKRLVDSLLQKLGERLICVLLCGSWARGEADPGRSDVDLTIIVDTVDEVCIELLVEAWKVSETGGVNIYGLDEVVVMAKDGLEMYTTTARVLWGKNPFCLPTKENFATDLATACENTLREVRSVLVYPWFTDEDKLGFLKSVFAKDRLYWALKNLVAFRTGSYPKNRLDLEEKLKGTPEEELYIWATHLTEDDYQERSYEIALRINAAARGWLKELS
jgi:hypothetical protein